MCRLISFVVPEGPPYYANSNVRAVARCEEHNWIMDYPGITETLCPLGRIEKAVEDGLATIAARLEPK